MSFFNLAPKPTSPLARHRILSPTAAVKVSPIQLGGISIGTSWNELFGENEDPFKLLDAYFELGGNFIDTSNIYNSEDSERLIGEWMDKRNVRDQMVIATKYTAGYKAYDRENLPLQSNFTGNSAKSMHVSVRDSLTKLRTDYIDLLYVHWWDFGTSVEEVMRHLHALVMAGKVLYLGVSDTPAWVVVKANEFARRNGYTPFSVYQGCWNAAYRDMEVEIIPMCEDQGMAVVPWAALGGGQLVSRQTAEDIKQDLQPRRIPPPSEDQLKVSAALETIAEARQTTMQAVALAYLFAQSTYVFPIVGVHTVDHVHAMAEALTFQLSTDEIRAIQGAAPFVPIFPMAFLFGKDHYHTRMTAADHKQYQMAAWIDAPPKLPSYEVQNE
ncbi:NADP-dependent oxidoreductase domain-containing protein [Aspergillus coremiiformis]|uniref:NADP-dependent oxidoreductase domain-containing protein n=1 Tax=Aspergillus coremiiformis TaxID=138285 RepID=A0A5N6Z9K8_9EURO|nr:NADP-dependent oxidoreductase domain-containing protein [Aspergillus coremiiformis]